MIHNSHKIGGTYGNACEHCGCGSQTLTAERPCQPSPEGAAFAWAGTPETVSATAPSHWAGYLINADRGELEQEEIETIRLFVAVCLSGHWPVTCEDAGFTLWHDVSQFGVGGSDCQTYTSTAR